MHHSLIVTNVSFSCFLVVNSPVQASSEGITDNHSQLEPSSSAQGLFDGRRSQIMECKNIWRFVFAAIAVLICSILHNRNVEKAKARAPCVGYRTSWEPTFLVRLRFIKGAWPIITDGYNKYKDSMFWIRRNDRDILILSNRFVDELRAIPEEKLSGTEAELENLRGPYYMDVAIRSTLHTRSLNQKMSPNLQAYGILSGTNLHMQWRWKYLSRKVGLKCRLGICFFASLRVSRQDSLWDCHSAGMRNSFEPRGILE